MGSVAAGVSAAAAAAALSLAALAPGAALARGSEIVGEFGTSGLVFKDTLRVEAIDDPKVKGVTLYISDFSIPITEKVQNGFNDPGAVGITCAKTGPVEIQKSMPKSKAGEDIFTESKSLFFGKSIKVRRVYDESRNTLLYISYSDRMDKSNDVNKSRFKSALCAIPLQDVGDSAGEQTAGAPAGNTVETISQ